MSSLASYEKKKPQKEEEEGEEEQEENERCGRGGSWKSLLSNVSLVGPLSGGGGSPLAQPVAWTDVGGLKDVKQALREALVLPHRYPAVFERFHLTAPSGVLLYGPPGCAKTTLVKALIASEGIFSFLYLDSANVLSAYVGESERTLRDVFQKAAQQAPCIVFFDEVEVLGRARESSSGGGGNRDARLLSTVLMEMDGFASSAGGRGVCFVGATNMPHLLDPALLRPGRLDHLLYVGLPDEEGRREILSHYLGHSGVPDVSFLAQHTIGFTGADLKALCSEALLEWCSKKETAACATWTSGVVTTRKAEHEKDATVSTVTPQVGTTMEVEDPIWGGTPIVPHAKEKASPASSFFVGSEKERLGKYVAPHSCPVTSFFYDKVRQFSPTVYPSAALEAFRRQAEKGESLN